MRSANLTIIMTKVIGDDYLVMIGKYKKDEKNHYGVGNVMSSHEEMKRTSAKSLKYTTASSDYCKVLSNS